MGCPDRLLRFPALLTIIAAIAGVSAARGAAPDLSSPRATFDTFLTAMVDAKQGRSDRVDDAVATLDLKSVPALLRREAPRIARDLKTFLDKTELIDVESLPEDVSGDRWVWRRTAAGEISLVRGTDDNWRFSKETIDSLEPLLKSVKDQGFVAGLADGGGAPRTLADWLRERMPATLRGHVFILENWQWLALALVVFVGVAFDRIVRVLIGVWLRRILRRSERVRDKGSVLSFEKPVGLLAMGIVWSLVLPLLGLPLNALAALKLATQLVISGAGVWAIYRLVDLLSAHFTALAARTESRVDDILIPLVRRAVKIVVLAFVILFMAQNLNIDITSLLAGLGIGGIAFALAAKDTVENLFGSMTVLIDRPFQIGDWVVIGDQEGTVEEIGFRSTRLRTFYNSMITIPNSRLVNSYVDNLGARRFRRFKCMVGVQYDTTPEKIDAFCEGIRELVRRHPYTRKDYYMVYFNEFAGSSLNILLYVFHETPDWATELRERHRLLVDVVRLAQRLGVDFAFPTQTLHLASVPPGFPAEPGPAADSAPLRPAGGGGAPREDAVRLGRAEAEAIVSGQWPGGPQAPVDFADPELIRPGPNGDGKVPNGA